MVELIKRLKHGVVDGSLGDEEADVVEQLQKVGLVYVSDRNGKKFYKLSGNVNVEKTSKGFLFELVPNSYMGVVFDYCDLFECVSKDKNAPGFYCLTYKLNPSEKDIRDFVLGDNVRVKVLARGYDIANEGLSVRLPRSEENYFAMEKNPCITIGLANGAKGKNTSSLDFDEPISGCFIEGRKALIINGKAYYSIKDVDVVSSIYSLEEKYGQYVVKKQSEKKIIR